MRLLTCLGAVASVLACSSSPLAATAGLHISLWPHGKGTDGFRSWTLRCDPAGGTLPQAADACRRLAALRDPFAPVAPGAACSQIYAGPGLALVQGTFRRNRISAAFKRTDSCQTARWNRVSFLFPSR